VADENEPRIRYEIPGYWTLPDEDRELLDRLMKARAEKRDLEEKRRAFAKEHPSAK
jgi:hypothetical protein